MVIAGEPPGDMRAAELIAGVQRQPRHAEWFGIGGPAHARSSASKPGYDVRKWPSSASAKYCKRYPFFRRVFTR
jgi:lipid A disaccharide synthetase